jgi:transcriptional regulator with XRE-family HTH domain
MIKTKMKPPAELRTVFGENLRRLSRNYSSVSDLSRQLRINRTQFNRYLQGESFPRPDVLARICDFFSVDARILLDRVDEIDAAPDPISNSFLKDFVGSGLPALPEDMFPNGFYRFTRRSFVRNELFIVGLVYVLRQSGHTYLRGYETREAMRIQGLPTDARTREFRGIAMRQEDGVTLLVSRRNAMTSSFNYLHRVASFDNNFWVGYVTRTVPDHTEGLRATRMVYEFLGRNMKAVLGAARTMGFSTEKDLLPFHRRLLRPELPFS